MAQYYTDFSEYPAAQKPSDWEIALGTFATNEVADDPLAINGKVYRIVCTGASERRVITWDTIPASAQVETLMRVKGGTGANFSGTIVRQAGATSATLTGMSVRPRSRDIREIEVTRYLDGAVSVLASNAFPNLSDVNAGDDIFLRQKTDGTIHYGKYWRATDPEPNDWDLSASSVSVSGEGKTALFMFTADSSMDVDWFSVGTDGDPAPTQPLDDYRFLYDPHLFGIASAIPTLSLPGVIDITATSARPQVTLTY